MHTALAHSRGNSGPVPSSALHNLSSCAPQAQAALSSADGLTMPQHTRHSLTHVLLLWLTILSIAQVVFIILFFTARHHSPYQNSSAVAPELTMQFQANNTPSSLSETHGLLLGKGKMLTFEGKEVNNKIKWVAKNPDEGLISEEEGGKLLKIKKAGYFFVNLRVTLTSCNASQGSQQEVSLKKDNKEILLGWINTNTCSTGFLGKVVELSEGRTLEVKLPPTTSINESLTHLDIICMLK